MGSSSGCPPMMSIFAAELDDIDISDPDLAKYAISPFSSFLPFAMISHSVTSSIVVKFSKSVTSSCHAESNLIS